MYSKSHIWVKVVSTFGHGTEHAIGSLIYVPMKDATEMIRGGYVDIHVNNRGYNSPNDVTEDDFDWDDLDD